MGRTPLLHKWLDQSAHVLIVDSHSGLRQVLVTVLRTLGFTQFTFARDTKELKHQLQFVKQVDWILATVEEVDGQNILQVLEKFYSDENNQEVRLSLFVNDKQKKALPYAFSLGLLSWHEAQFHMEKLEADFRELQHRIHLLAADEMKVAASYLRDYLTECRDFKSLVTLEKTLAGHYYRDEKQMLALAEAHFLAGETELGKQALIKASYFDPALADDAQALHEKYIGFSTAAAKSFAASLGISRAVIVDHDAASRKTVASILTKIGFAEIQEYEDGQTAWEAIRVSEKEPHLIVTEWRLRELSGPFFIQRVRAHGLKLVPIIVASSLLTKDDAQLIKDMYIAQVIQKPLRESQLIMTLAWALKQMYFPSEAKPLERKIVGSLQTKDFKGARSFRRQYDGIHDVSLSRREYLAGCFAFYTRKYIEASQHFVTALSVSDGDNVDITDMLGRTLLQLGDVTAAAALMERASQYSPKNIERLCQLADIKLEMGAIAQAEETLQQARDKDAGHENVVVTATKISLVAEEFDRAKHLMQGLQSFDQMVAFMNNRGALFIKTGKLNEGMTWYLNALDTIPVEAQEYFAIVNYNMALALIKIGEQKLAQVYLKKAFDVGEKSRVYWKAQSLRERLKDAIAKGETVKLIHDEKPLKADQKMLATIGKHLQLAPFVGDSKEVCLNQLWHGTQREAFLEIMMGQKKPGSFGVAS